MENTQKKILVVDDTKSYLFILSQTLIAAGFAIATAENGEEGLVAAKNEKPDLILLDITMPKMDGITMSKKLKEEQPLAASSYLFFIIKLYYILNRAFWQDGG